MIPYKKYQIRRIKELNDSFFEVVFQKGSLTFVPGNTVTLYKGPDHPIFIASGISECWVRLIMNRDLFSTYFPPGTRYIKLNSEIISIFPDLAAEKSPSFIFDAQGIGAFFSWASMYPSTKCKVCYLGEDKVQEDWIAGRHILVKSEDILEMKDCEDLYITGNRDLFKGDAGEVLDNCKASYLVD